MSHRSATIEWQRNAENFLDQRYSRRHHWRFDGGTEVRHEEAHHECFLANSVTATIRCLPVSGTP